MRSNPARKLNVYLSRDGFRWRLVSAGRIVAESGEAYTRNRDAIRAARRTFGGDYPIVLGHYDGASWVEERLR